jgi:hypothetical protein
VEESGHSVLGAARHSICVFVGRRLVVRNFPKGDLRMFNLPPSLTRHFQDASGTVDPLRVLRAPDDQLLHIARDMPYAERVDLYRQLDRLRVGFVERLAARAAGVDVDAQRARFLRILEAAG